MPVEASRNGFSFPITSLAGSSVSNLIRIKRSHKIDKKYHLRFAATFLVCLLMEPLKWWEDIAWRSKIRKTKISEKPVFIIGFWRSGTTLLHNYLCRDPKAAYVNTFQTVFPNVILSHYRWIRYLANILMPTHRPFDGMKMGLEYPQEEEIAMANLQQFSFYKFWYFPNDFELFYKKDLFLKDIKEDKLNNWKKQYFKLIKKAILFTKGERFTSKNPSNMVRIRILLDMFPGARFIFIHRDPYRVIQSVSNFSSAVLPAIELQEHTVEWPKSTFINLYKGAVSFYNEEKKIVPEGQLVEVSYEHFLEDQIGTIRKIYEKLNLDGFEQALPKFIEYQKEASKFKKKKYRISPETVEMVRASIDGLLDDAEG